MKKQILLIMGVIIAIFMLSLGITILDMRYLEVQRDYQRLKDSLYHSNREYIQLKKELRNSKLSNFRLVSDLSKEKIYETIEVDVTAYSPDPDQTWGDDPFRMASNLKATPNDLWQLKYIAISRDLKEKYNLKWGDKIYLEFEIQDLMGKTAQEKIIEKTVDIFMRSQEIAFNFGRQKRRIIIDK